MDNDPLISVIIPVFNVRSFLADALDSVLCQTYENIEIIIVDDGSTDGSGDICKEYEKKDKRIRLIRQTNKGLSAARNIGLSLLRGEAVAFLDSDDVLHPHFLKTMLNVMVAEKTDLVMCKYSVINASNNTISLSALNSRPLYRT